MEEDVEGYFEIIINPPEGNLIFKFTRGDWENPEGNENVSILDTNYPIPELERRIWVYLPPDYESAPEKYYPVLYMHDGQNVFETATSFSGEWEVDESLNTLHENGDYGCIVVAIDNGGAFRIDEYSPWINTQYGGG